MSIVWFFLQCKVVGPWLRSRACDCLGRTLFELLVVIKLSRIDEGFDLGCA